VMFAPRKLSEMDRQDKVRACYQHAALLYVSNKIMTNATLRQRFSIEERNYSIASRIIADTMRENLIKAKDPASTSRKHARYVPFWA
jgi:ATP-dependent DNA helicase RecG